MSILKSQLTQQILNQPAHASFTSYAMENRANVHEFATFVVETARLIGSLGVMALVGLATTSENSGRSR